MSWLSGWDYRKSHEIVGSTAGAVTDYQIRIKVHYGSGTDSGEDVYLNEHCRTDFGDVRFTSDDGVTELPYWMEEKVDGDYAVFWVKIPSIPASPDTATIYIYYGNPDATTTSNQMLTGIAQLKEHKNYSAYDPNILFNKPTDTEIRIDSYSTGSSSLGEGFVFFVVPASWINGKYVRWKWDGYFSYSEARVVAEAFIMDGEYDRKSSSDFPSGGAIATKGNGRLQTLYQENVALTWGAYTRDVLVNISPALPYVTLFFRMGDGWTGQTVYLDIDFIEANTDAGGSGNIITLHFTESVRMEVTGTLNDYGLFRKYISPEPSHGAWGLEEYFGVIEVYASDSSSGTDLASAIDKLIEKIFESLDYATGLELAILWLAGWLYRKQHVIEGSSAGAVTDYQIRIVVHYGVGTDSGEDVYLNEHCRTDFGDVRFTDSDGITELPYWMEEKVDGDYAIFWVKVPSIPASPDTATIYIYYGKSDATTTSNGEATFQFFDDFLGTSLDLTKWDVQSGASYEVSESHLRLNGLSLEWNFGEPYVYSKSSWGDYRVVCKMSHDTDESLGDLNYWLIDVNHYYAIQHETRAGGHDNDFVYEDGEGTTGFIADFRYEWNVNEEVRYELRLYGSSVYHERHSISNPSRQTSGSVSNPRGFATTGRKIGFSGDALSGQLEVDWVFVTKYVDPEPSHSIWGSEEIYTPTKNVVVSNESVTPNSGFVGDSVTYSAIVKDEDGNPLPEDFVADLLMNSTVIIDNQHFVAGVYDSDTGELTLVFTVPSLPSGTKTVKLKWEEQTI